MVSLLTPEQLQKNITSGKVTEAKKGNQVSYSQQWQLTKQITPTQLKEWYKVAKEQGLVADLPSYVKWLNEYGVEAEWRQQAQNNKVKYDLEKEKRAKVANAPRYKNMLMWMKDSLLSVPSMIQKWGLSLLSNTAEEIAMMAWNDELAQRFENAQQATQQQMKDFWDIGQNEESWFYKWWKIAWDIIQTATAWAGIMWGLKGTKAMQVIDNVANMWRIWKTSVTAWNIWLWAVWWVWEQYIYSAIADQKLPTQWELWVAGVLGWAIPLLPLIPAWFRAMKWAPRTMDDIAWAITQAKDPRQAKNMIEWLTEFDFSKADDITYETLWSNVKQKIQTMIKSVDGITIKYSAPVDDLAVVTTKQWDNLIWDIWGIAPEWSITRNYWKEWLELLKGHYEELWDNQMILELAELWSKKVVTGKDINRLARMIPSDDALNTFAKNGSPKTWKLAQSVENLRKWIKTTVRQLAWDNTEVLTNLDKRISNLISLDEQIKKNIEWVRGLKNKIVPRTMWEKVWRMLSNVIDTISMWTWRGLVTWSLKGNVGNKVLNRLDVEKNLAKNLKLLQKMDDFIELWWKTNIDELVEAMAKETGYSVDDIMRMGEDIASVDELAKQADNLPTQATQQLDNVPSPTASLDDMLKNATDEELKEQWFTATMIKKIRKQKPTTNKEWFDNMSEKWEWKPFNSASPAPSAIQDIAQQSDELLQTPSVVSKVDDALPTAWKMDWKGLPKSKSLESVENLVWDIKKVWDWYEVSYIRNTEKSPNLWSKFWQDIEPAWQYFSISEWWAKWLPDTYEVGKKTFKKPLVVERKSTDANWWKWDISKMYWWKTWKKLSQAIVDDWYDWIVTRKDIWWKKYTSESVDLTSFQTPTWLPAIWKTTPEVPQKAKSLEPSDLTSSIKKAKAEGKTFEEFVDKNTPYLHWTEKNFDTFSDKRGVGVFVTKDTKTAQQFAWTNWKVIKSYLSPDAKIFDFWNKENSSLLVNKLQKEVYWPNDVYWNKVIDRMKSWKRTQADAELPEVREIIKELWYDWFTTRETVDWSINYWILNKDKLKTTSQLRTERDKLDQPTTSAIWKTLPKKEIMYSKSNEWKRLADWKPIKEDSDTYRMLTRAEERRLKAIEEKKANRK